MMLPERSERPTEERTAIEAGLLEPKVADLHRKFRQSQALGAKPLNPQRIYTA
jgi:hypothetical protein